MKKAALNVSVRTIIIIILALLLFIILLALIKNLFGKTSVQVDEQLSGYALPPVVIISSPSPANIYTVFQTLLFDGSKSYDLHHKIAGYFWDFDGDRVIDSNQPVYNHSYWEPGEYNVSLKVVNEPGAIGAASQILRVYTRNNKSNLLNDSMIFIRDNDRANRDNILRLIPVTTWNDLSGFHSIPFYVYHVPDTTTGLPLTNYTNLLQQYGKRRAYVFDDAHSPCAVGACAPYDTTLPATTACCDVGGGRYIVNVPNIDDIYFEFWDFYEYVVLVDNSITSSSLISALFAGFYNAPIIFIDNSNLAGYQSDISNLANGPTQRIYYVPSLASIDPNVEIWVRAQGWDRQVYSEQELRNPSGVNRIIRLNSNVTMG